MNEELTIEQYRRMHSGYHPEDIRGHDPYDYDGPNFDYNRRRKLKRELNNFEQIVLRVKLTWKNIKWLTRYDLSEEYHAYDFKGDY